MCRSVPGTYLVEEIATLVEEIATLVEEIAVPMPTESSLPATEREREIERGGISEATFN